MKGLQKACHNFRKEGILFGNLVTTVPRHIKENLTLTEKACLKIYNICIT